MITRSNLMNRYTDNNTDPFFSINRALQRSLDDALRGFTTGMTIEATSMPVSMDVKENDNNFMICADLPGLTEKDVDVSFDDGMLTIRGNKTINREDNNDMWHIVERSSGSFMRRISLSAPIDVNNINAKFDNGVLNITLPKLAQEKNTAKKIEIKKS